MSPWWASCRFKKLRRPDRHEPSPALCFDLVDLKTGGGSDGNFTAPFAPTLDGMGVDGDGAHTPEERLYISSVLPRTRLLMRLMETLG